MRLARIGVATGYFFLFCLRPRQWLWASTLLDHETRPRTSRGAGRQPGRRVTGQGLSDEHGSGRRQSLAQYLGPSRRVECRSHRAGLTPAKRARPSLRERVREGCSSGPVFRRNRPATLGLAASDCIREQRVSGPGTARRWPRRILASHYRSARFSKPAKW